jgi:hypothetical protein
MTPRTRQEAIAQGFSIDDGQRPVAYKGPRFNPHEYFCVPTEEEEELVALLQRAADKLQDYAWEDTNDALAMEIYAALEKLT